MTQSGSNLDLFAQGAAAATAPQLVGRICLRQTSDEAGARPASPLLMNGYILLKKPRKL